MAENQLACPNFGERASDGVGDSSAVCDYSGKKRAQIVTAYGKIHGTQENNPVTFNRADRHARNFEKATYVQTAVAENLHACRAANGMMEKSNTAAGTSARATVGD